MKKIKKDMNEKKRDWYNYLVNPNTDFASVKKEKWLILCHLCTLMKWAIIYEAVGAQAKFGTSQKSNH